MAFGMARTTRLKGNTRLTARQGGITLIANLHLEIYENLAPDHEVHGIGNDAEGLHH